MSKEITAMILDDARPMQFCEEKTGKAFGFAVDCMRVIVKRAGFTVTYKFGHDFTELIGKLKRGEADVLPSFALSEERRIDADFIEPLDSTSTMFFAKAKDTSIEGLRSVLRIGAVRGSIMHADPPEFFRKGANR